MFGEYDFMVQKLSKSYIIRLFRKAPRSEALPKRLLQRDDGSHRRGNNPMVGMTVAVTVAIEEASK